MKRGIIFVASIIIFTILIAAYFIYGQPQEEQESTEIENIVLISIDSLRSDHLPCYGYERDTAPTICELANHSLLFENAMTTKSLTLPAHTSLFTGMYPINHRIYENYQENDKQNRFLAEILSGYNYSTYAITNSIILQVESFTQGFNKVRYIKENRKDSGAGVSLFGQNVIQNTDNFLLFLHYYQVHHPYNAPDDYNTHFTEINKSNLEFTPEDVYLGYKNNLSSQGKEYITDQYDADIRYVDDQVRKIINKLIVEDKLKKTIIIITADHGELLGDFERDGEYIFGHGDELNEEEIKIPLILYDPRDANGKRIKEDRSIVDIFPTILEILNIDIDYQINGQSLLHERTIKPYANSRNPKNGLTNFYYFLNYEEFKYFILNHNICNEDIPENAICLSEDCNYYLLLQNSRSNDLTNNLNEESSDIKTIIDLFNKTDIGQLNMSSKQIEGITLNYPSEYLFREIDSNQILSYYPYDKVMTIEDYCSSYKRVEIEDYREQLNEDQLYLQELKALGYIS